MFQQRECGESQADEVCSALDALAFVIFLSAIAACLANPLRLGYLTLRERSLPRTNFFLYRHEGSNPGALEVT